MSPRRRFILAIALCSAAALAQETSPSPSVEPLPAKADVVVHGRTAFVLYAPSGSASAAERARATSKILGGILEQPGEPPVTLAPLPEGQLIRVGEKDLIRLGPGDAAASGL